MFAWADYCNSRKFLLHTFNMLRTLNILLVLISLTSIGHGTNLSPFCQFCDYTQANGAFTIKCTRNIMALLFDNNSWISETNESYPIEELSVQNTPVLSLNKKFPRSNLRILRLNNNSIVNITDDVFMNLQNLTELSLSYNQIEIIHPNAFRGVYAEGAFEPLKSLKILSLDHNRLHTLMGDVFEHTSFVEELYLGHNPIKVMDPNIIRALSNLVYLKKLDLSHTGISSLPDYFMHTPKYITLLDLSGNNFNHIPATLSDSHSLEKLYFNDNPIVNLTKQNGFPQIATLRELHMRNMPKLVNISDGALSSLENLTALYLYDNPELKYISKNALSARRNGSEYETWPPIKTLYLQNNKLTTMDMHLILTWTALTELDLTDNPWTCECENQWMVDELMDIYLHINPQGAKSMRCAAPVEMVQFTIYDIREQNRNMRCLDYYGNRPERDGALLVGILAGVLITIPLVLSVIYCYRRHWFGIFDDSPASFSRQFYSRTSGDDI